MTFVPVQSGDVIVGHVTLREGFRVGAVRGRVAMTTGVLLERGSIILCQPTLH